jgi:hypothetical protein
MLMPMPSARELPDKGKRLRMVAVRPHSAVAGTRSPEADASFCPLAVNESWTGEEVLFAKKSHCIHTLSAAFPGNWKLNVRLDV